MTEPKWAEAHRRAIAEGATHYLDPDSGYRVISELGHRERGECCGSGCRHCPWGNSSGGIVP